MPSLPAGVAVYAIDHVASDTELIFHLRYDGAMRVTLSGEPRLFVVYLLHGIWLPGAHRRIYGQHATPVRPALS